MIRQLEENVLLLTKSEALARLPFGRHSFDSLINKGEVGFKKVGNRYYFPVTEIERWANNLEHRTASTPEVKATGHILLSKPKTENDCGLDALVAQRTLEKQRSSAMRKLQAYKQKETNKPMMSFQA